MSRTRTDSRGLQTLRWGLVATFVLLIAGYFAFWRKRESARPNNDPDLTANTDEPEPPSEPVPPPRITTDTSSVPVATGCEQTCPPNDTACLNACRGVIPAVDAGVGTSNGNNTTVGTGPALAIVDAGEDAAINLLPVRPAVGLVRDALSKLQAEFVRCAAGRPGYAVLSFDLRGDTGQVNTVRVVNPPFANTPEGNCIEAVARSIEVGRFQLSSATISYPVSLGRGDGGVQPTAQP